MSNRPLPEPQEPKAYIFHQALRLFNAILPGSVRAFMRLLLFQISPDVPASLTIAWRDASLNAVFTIAALLTLIMCFGVVSVWSVMAGTFTGSDPTRLYFSKDWVNLLNYTLLCPMYVGFGAVLIATTVRGSAELKQLISPDGRGVRPARRHLGVFLLLLLMLVSAFFANAKFMTENLNPSIYRLNYWFMEHVRPDGSRVIGAFGFYYGLLNFCLLLFSIVVAAALISEFRLLIQIADSLDRLKTEKAMTTEVLRQQLTTFTQAYLAGKLVVVSYMVNALAWKTSQAQHSTNLVMLGGALTFFGVIFLSIPRYYIELQWFRLRAARPDTDVAVSEEYVDLRSWTVDFLGRSWKPRVVAHVLDTLMIGGFILNFWM
jgi:hypothetical protein